MSDHLSKSRPHRLARVALTLAAAAVTALSVRPAHAQDAPAAPTGVTISGVIEANYTLNFNQPANGSNTYLFNSKEGQFALNLADLRIAKNPTAKSRTGFFLRLIEGEVRQRNFNPGEANPSNPAELPYVLEAYGTFLAPVGKKDLKVDVGQFVTHVGYETIDIGTNNFFSRNFLFQFPSPFYNQGVRAALPVSPKTTVTAFLLNRYNGSNDTGNRDLAPGLQILHNFNDNANLTFNFLTSRENLAYTGYSPGSGAVSTPFPTPNNKQQTVLDLIYQNQFTKSFKVVAEGLYRFGKNSDNDSYSVPGGALYGIFTFKSGNVAALRAETMTTSKANNPALPTYPLSGDANTKVRLGSISASYEIKKGFLPNLRTLLEYRYDFAGKPFFAGKKTFTAVDQSSGIADYKKNQSTFTIGQVYSF